MELSARDKRILTEIECESALEDPKWARRFERLGLRGTRPRASRRRRLAGVFLAAVWLAAIMVGAMALPPMLVLALVCGVVGCVAWSARRRRIHGFWFRRRRLITRIPRQDRRG